MVAGAQLLFTVNDMETKMFARLTMFAVVALALAVGGARATPLSYGTYYDEEELVAVCNSGIACIVPFSAVPSDQLLLLKKVNCQINSNQPLIAVAVSISQTHGGTSFGRGIRVNPGIAVVTTGGTQYFYSFQTDAQILIGQGRFPFIEADTGSSSAMIMTCGILGDLVTPIQ
jgi:hypothetical protein